ncbi:ATP-binding protein [Bdellovibrionota bacterium FG-2]
MSKIATTYNNTVNRTIQTDILSVRLAEKRRFIQILQGPRQVGKTTLAHQVVDRLKLNAHFESADDKQLQGRAWIYEQWQIARTLNKQVLVLDEIQKIKGWSETVKLLWDEDARAQRPLHVVLLGSSALMIGDGLTESLAGRIEIIRVPHWSYPEMHSAFGTHIDEFIFFGGYPGTAGLFNDFPRWRRMVLDALIETTISRDILLHASIEKPALLRHLFQLTCEFSSQILSYQKMIGQLQDVGNTTTLAHYLRLLEGAGLCKGLQKYEGKKHRLRSSIPKLQVFNTALISAQNSMSLIEAKTDPGYWGRLTESAVGAHLLNQAIVEGFEVLYWREGNFEVDFVIDNGIKPLAFEVKSERKPNALPGMTKFLSRYPTAKPYLIGSGGMSFEDFFATPLKDFF